MSQRSPKTIPLNTFTSDPSAGNPSADRMPSNSATTAATSHRTAPTAPHHPRPPLRPPVQRRYTILALLSLSVQSGSVLASLANPQVIPAIGHYFLLLGAPASNTTVLVTLAMVLTAKKRLLCLNPATAALLPALLGVSAVLGGVALSHSDRVALALRFTKPYDALALQLYGATVVGLFGVAQAMALWYSMGRWAGFWRVWSEVDQVLQSAAHTGPMATSFASGLVGTEGAVTEPSTTPSGIIPSSCKDPFTPPPPYRPFVLPPLTPHFTLTRKQSEPENPV
ncbi:hypothetical protein BCR35DRAFT_307012 [Leucosporidium creatinivorum]|uniref:Uncharacterized protein n=1 Tax=Leucosporidium creatinivorum TaxID=106004 RepID=A0A1Y2EQL5_9BASI|nr:hypothetical protein BCR35DRAFT_307012 [Leucosporidium creatinivorum]